MNIERSGNTPRNGDGLLPGNRSLVALVCVMLLTLGGSSQPALATEASGLATATHLFLPKGASSQEFTFTFPISEEEWDQGQGWVRRQVRTSDSLAIVDENLTRQTYRVVVRLVGSQKQSARGSLYLFLKKGPANAAFPERPSAPENLRVIGRPLQPDFLFDGKGETSAFALFRDADGEEIWSRSFSEAGWGRLDEGTLEIDVKYLLKAQQSNAAARYSPPSYLWFRVVGKKQRCPGCGGSGQKPTPADQSGPVVACPGCGGAGHLVTPKLEMLPGRPALEG